MSGNFQPPLNLICSSLAPDVFCALPTVNGGRWIVCFFWQQTSSWNLYVCLYIRCESSLWNISWYNLNGHMRRANCHSLQHLSLAAWWGVGLMPCFWWEAMWKLCMQVFDCKSLLVCPISMVFPQGELLVAITSFCSVCKSFIFVRSKFKRIWREFWQGFFWFTVKAPPSDRSQLRSLIDLQLIWRNGKGKAIVWQLVEALFSP